MYQLHKNFFDPEYCDYVYELALNHFVPVPKRYKSWKASTNKDHDFATVIKNRLSELYDLSSYNISWVNLTEYDNDRFLQQHIDTLSDMTFVIQLTDGFVGGEFIIEDEEIRMDKGDCIFFNGGKLRHGVKAVTDGKRAAINVWTKKKPGTFVNKLI